MTTHRFTLDEARRLGEEIGIDWATSPFDAQQFRQGLEVEQEHDARDPRAGITHDDLVATARIAWAHLQELPDYYAWLAVIETDGLG